MSDSADTPTQGQSPSDGPAANSATSLTLEPLQKVQSVGVGTGTGELVRDRIKIYTILNTLADDGRTKGLPASCYAYKWTEFQYMIPVTWVRSTQVECPGSDGGQRVELL